MFEFPTFLPCPSGSYQGLIYKTTKSVARKGNRFFVLRYKSLAGFAIFSCGKRYVKSRDMFASQTRNLYRTMLPRGNISHRQIYRICLLANISRLHSRYIAFLHFRNAKISLRRMRNITLYLSGEERGTDAKCNGALVESSSTERCV